MLFNSINSFGRQGGGMGFPTFHILGPEGGLPLPMPQITPQAPGTNNIGVPGSAPPGGAAAPSSGVMTDPMRAIKGMLPGGGGAAPVTGGADAAAPGAAPGAAPAGGGGLMGSIMKMLGGGGASAGAGGAGAAGGFDIGQLIAMLGAA